MIDPALDYPEEPPEGAGAAPAELGTLRYDDVVQDGRLRAEAIWRSTGKLLWSHPEAASILRSMRPDESTVLTRTVSEAGELRVSPRERVALTVQTRFELAEGPAEGQERIVFSSWLRASREGAAAEPPLARAYGQRVFARPHAPRGEHLVQRLAGFGPTGVPDRRSRWEPPDAVLALPAGAVPLEPGLRPEPRRITFALTHTDLNQHVNFLVYHRLFEEAAVARLAELGLGARGLVRHVALGYRRPSHAGDRVSVALQAFRLGGAPGVVAALVDDAGGDEPRALPERLARPRVVARLLLRD